MIILLASLAPILLLLAAPARATDDTDATPPSCLDQLETWVLPFGDDVPADAVLRVGTNRRGIWGAHDPSCSYTLQVEVFDGNDVILDERLQATAAGDEQWDFPDLFVPDTTYDVILEVETSDFGQTRGSVSLTTTLSGTDPPPRPDIIDSLAFLQCDRSLSVRATAGGHRALDVAELWLDGERVDTTAPGLPVDPALFAVRTFRDHTLNEGDDACLDLRLVGIDGAVGEPVEVCHPLGAPRGCEESDLDEDRGCACSTSSPAVGWLFVVLGALALVRRRRT